MEILIGADIVPTKSNINSFVSGNAVEMVGKEICNILDDADFRIFNLEVPLVDKEMPISKIGPNLIAPAKCVFGYKALKSDLLTLANNHIMDQGLQGLESTMNLLDQVGISYVGAGKNLKDASKPYIFVCGQHRIGIYACAEHEFSIATETSEGANPIDFLETPDHVASLKSQCDYVIVLYHGGKEQYRYPSPTLQKVCHKLVEKGADLIVCQHSHCIGCEEKYKDSTIVYGQGNFLFNKYDNEFWSSSLLIRITDGFKIDYIPIKRCGNGICIAKGDLKERIIKDFTYRSNEIMRSEAVTNRYAELANENIGSYLLNMLGIRRGIVFRVLNRISGYRLERFIIAHICKKKVPLVLMNYIECEAHRDLILEGLKEVTR